VYISEWNGLAVICRGRRSLFASATASASGGGGKNQCADGALRYGTGDGTAVSRWVVVSAGCGVGDADGQID